MRTNGTMSAMVRRVLWYQAVPWAHALPDEPFGSRGFDDGARPSPVCAAHSAGLLRGRGPGSSANSAWMRSTLGMIAFRVASLQRRGCRAMIHDRGNTGEAEAVPRLCDQHSLVGLGL